MSLWYDKRNIPLAKALRKDATPQEKHLWYDFLSGYPVRFQRQKAIDRFIADFYCHQAQLIVEIDGSGHYTLEGERQDAFRTEVLEDYGLTVIRFTNRQVDENFEGVCAYIDMVVRNSLSQPNG